MSLRLEAVFQLAAWQQLLEHLLPGPWHARPKEGFGPCRPKPSWERASGPYVLEAGSLGL